MGPARAYLPLTTDGAVAEVVIFHADQFPRLGLPERLPAERAEPS
jgi:RNA polymerase sigma-70 factor (ECF subfamily)